MTVLAWWMLLAFKQQLIDEWFAAVGSCIEVVVCFGFTQAGEASKALDLLAIDNKNCNIGFPIRVSIVPVEAYLN